MWIPLILVLITTLIYYLKRVYSHWDRKGFPFIKPSFPFGNLGPLASQKLAFGTNIYELHKASSLPYVGIYLLFRPALLVRDSDIIKHMLTTDFTHFHDRGIYCNPKHDPLSENMFAMPGQRWKTLRAKLTPSFSSGKIKRMFPTILDEGDRLQKFLIPHAEKNAVVEIKDILSRYTLNVVASVIFGIDCDSLSNPEHEFRNIEKEINSPAFITAMKSGAVFLCPKVLEFFRTSSISKNIQDFMIKMVKQTIEYREANKITRKDLMQYLIELRNTGKINESDDVWDVETAAENLKSMSIETCAAQIFLFYAAGFETASSLIAYTIFEISRDKQILQKMQQEIDEKIMKFNGEVTYEFINELSYVELVISDIIRKYPALPILNRECTEDYKIPNSYLTIEKGTSIIISLLGISRDPDYFPDPLKIIPERYLHDGSHPYTTSAYIPFGDGPRSCPAIRLGKVISKIGIVKLLQSYDFKAVQDKEIEFDIHGVTLQPKGGINVVISKREF